MVPAFPDLAGFFFDSGLLVLIWLVQLVIYPAFREIEGKRFRAGHACYSFRVSFVVIPLMFGQLVVSLFRFIAKPGWTEGLHLGACLFALIATFALAVPLHRQLGNCGADNRLIERLLRVNAARTAAWSLAWLVGVALLSGS